MNNKFCKFNAFNILKEKNSVVYFKHIHKCINKSF